MGGFSNCVNVLFPEPFGPAKTTISGFFCNPLTITPLPHPSTEFRSGPIVFFLINNLGFSIIDDYGDV